MLHIPVLWYFGTSVTYPPWFRRVKLVVIPPRFILQQYLWNIAIQPAVGCYNSWANLRSSGFPIRSGKIYGETGLFSCLHLRHWPMAYLMMLSDWFTSCQSWPPCARYGQWARSKQWRLAVYFLYKMACFNGVYLNYWQINSTGISMWHKNRGLLQPRFLSTESLGPCFSHSGWETLIKSYYSMLTDFFHGLFTLIWILVL